MIIKKKRKIQLLEQLISLFRTGRWGDGLCITIGFMYDHTDVTSQESKWLKKTIYAYKPKKPNFHFLGIERDYFYKPSLVTPRVRLINRIIKDIKKGVNR